MLQTILAKLRTVEPTAPWGLDVIGIGFVVWFGLFIVGSVVSITFIGADTPFASLLARVITMVSLGVFIGWWKKSDVERDALRLVSDPNSRLPVMFWVLISYGVAVTLDILSFTVTQLFEPPLALRPLLLTHGVSEWVLAVAFALILQPVAEGLLFSGLLYPAFRQLAAGKNNSHVQAGSLSVAAAITSLILCAGAVAMFQWFAYASAVITPQVVWYGLFVPFVSAVWFTGVRAYTGSTRTAIIAQMGFGLFAISKLILIIMGSG
jgi:hypothetical protein